MDAVTWFNAPLLKALRKQLGWTQEELASRADLSVRVIAKAEAGQVVSAKTRRALVAALQKSGKQVDEADLTCNPEQLVRAFLKNYVEHQAECVAVSREMISPNIVAFVDGDPATNPIAGTYRGIEEFERFWRKFFAIFVRDGGTLGEESQLRCIGNEVFVWGHEHIRVPEAAPQPAGFVMLRIRVEGGKMAYFEDRYEANGMMRQLDDWSREFPEAEWLRHFDRDVLADGKYLKYQKPPTPPEV
jgi:transcriptional regulator with XRE-family HTH domain